MVSELVVSLVEPRSESNHRPGGSPMRQSLLGILLLSSCAAPGPVIPPDAKFELVWADAEFTEGPALAPDGSIYFSDIGNRILRFDPKTMQTSVYRDPSGRSHGMKFDAKGRLVVCDGGATRGNA